MLIELNGCDACTLRHDWRKLRNPRMPVCVPTLYSDVRIAVIGEGPGEEEDETGIPFTGTSGRFLRECIPDDWQHKVWITNMVRCRPAANRQPEVAELACCSTYLERDLIAIRPHVILCIGGVALDYFWEGSGITAARGIPFPVQLADGTWVWCYSTFHPSYVLRGRDKNRGIEPVFRSDLTKFFSAAHSFITPPKQPPPLPSVTEVQYPKTQEQVLNLIARLQSKPGIDIETRKLKPYLTGAKMLTAAFSDGELTFAFNVDWEQNGGGKEALCQYFKAEMPWIAHNASFELAWFQYLFQDFVTNFEDTEAQARVKYGRTTMLSLADQSRIHLGSSIKGATEVDARRIENYPLDRVLYYNALDAWACKQIDNVLYPTLTPVELQNYKRCLESIQSTVTMEVLGLPVDLDTTESLKRELLTKLETYQEQAQTLGEVRHYCMSGKQFMISAPADVAAVLMAAGIRLPKTESDNYSTGKDILEDLSGKHPLVDIVLDYREVAKLQSTYITPILTGKALGSDGLLHPSYTVVLTSTGRLSSRDLNIQNFPKRKHREVRRQVIPPPGYIIVSADYGQIEARGLAMASGDKNLIQSFINHEDIHSKWLNRLIKLYPSYLDRLAKRTGETEEQKIRKAGRDLVKTDMVFASFYGSDAKAVSARTQIPYTICEEVLDEFWKTYSGVRKWIDGQLESYLRTGQIQTLTGLVRNEILPGNEYNNNVIQGTAAHIVLDAQNAIWQMAVTDCVFFFLPRYNIHDDIGFFWPEEQFNEEALKPVTDEMVKPRYPFSTVPLTVEIKAGYNWADLETITVVEGGYVQ